MTVKAVTYASETIIKEVREAEAFCKEYDNLNGNMTLDPSLNFDKDMKSLFLLYDENKLISVLSVFAPAQNEAEITAFTLPEYRQKGHFKRLLGEALTELKKYRVPDLLFVCEPQSTGGMETIEKLGAKYEFSEYLLKFNASFDLSYKYGKRITLLRAGIKDLEDITALSQLVFNDEYENAKSITEKTLNSNNRKQYTANLNGELIGIGSVSYENGEASIFGLGISPQYRGKGYGHELLVSIIEDIISGATQNITIEVDSTNITAFELYKKCGFMTDASYDYYRLHL